VGLALDFILKLGILKKILKRLMPSFFKGHL